MVRNMISVVLLNQLKRGTFSNDKESDLSVHVQVGITLFLVTSFTEHPFEGFSLRTP